MKVKIVIYFKTGERKFIRGYCFDEKETVKDHLKDSNISRITIQRYPLYANIETVYSNEESEACDEV